MSLGTITGTLNRIMTQLGRPQVIEFVLACQAGGAGDAALRQHLWRRKRAGHHAHQFAAGHCGDPVLFSRSPGGAGTGAGVHAVEHCVRWHVLLAQR